MAHPDASFVRKTGQAMYLKNFLAQTEELKKTPSMRSWVSIFELTFAYLKEEVDTALFQEALRTALNACEADQVVLCCILPFSGMGYAKAMYHANMAFFFSGLSDALYYVV